jgi:hypothetical protein
LENLKSPPLEATHILSSESKQIAYGIKACCGVRWISISEKLKNICEKNSAIKTFQTLVVGRV